MSNINFKLITNKNGYVGFYMTAGKHMVHDLTIEKTALGIIKDGKEVKESDRIVGFPLCVDDKYYFEAIIKKPKAKKKREV